jgi:hypothetical protein
MPMFYKEGFSGLSALFQWYDNPNLFEVPPLKRMS